MRTTLSTALLAVLGVFCFISTVDASAQTLRVSLEELAGASDRVVMGRTVSTESAWNADRSAILTRVTIRVEDPATGAVTGQEIVTVPGGQVGEYLHEVSDMPIFAENEEVVVFLTRHDTGVMIVTGGTQGKMEVRTDPATGERTVLGAAHLLKDDAVDTEPLKSGARPLMEVDEVNSTLPLLELIRKVKALQ